MALMHNHLIDYPSPISLTYAWSFGLLAAMCLFIQIISGIFLAMHYTPHIDLAFSSLEHLMRDVRYGWLLRYTHANGASMFFIVVYCHIFRGLFFGSYMPPREHLWCSGIIIFLLMMATAFMGYVLPWGQMSFWGATVITNLFSVIPFLGNIIVQWLWGGFCIDNATLNRFFSLHFLLPFIIAGLVLIHIALLHKDGSNNPTGTWILNDKIAFYPYYYQKDFFSFMIFLNFFIFIIFFFPNSLGHPDNYITANPMSTPAHIVPEWYFLPFYAILRSIPSKIGGVVAMLGAIILLLTLPFTNRSIIRSAFFRPLFEFFFWFIISDFILLGWIGQAIVEKPFVEIGQIGTLFYFFYFSFIFFILGILEKNFIKKY